MRSVVQRKLDHELLSMPGNQGVHPLPRGQRGDLRGELPRQHERMPAPPATAWHDDLFRSKGTCIEHQSHDARRDARCVSRCNQQVRLA